MWSNDLQGPTFGCDNKGNVVHMRYDLSRKI